MYVCIQGKQLVDNLDGAGKGAVSKHKKRKYRQYMNRRGATYIHHNIAFIHHRFTFYTVYIHTGGFNRPLQKMD